MLEFRIAVLECDTPLEEVQRTHGTYGDIFARILRKSLPKDIAVTPVITTWSIVSQQKYPGLGDVDAILLTGSKHDSFSDDPWITTLVDYVRRAYDENKILVGMCFGHQIIGRALGGKVGRNPNGWEISVCDINLTDQGFHLFGKKSLVMHQMHRDVVLTVPNGVQNLGSSDVTEVQGLYSPRRVLTLQSHPEFDDVIMQALISTRFKMGIFDQSMFDNGIPRAQLPHDGLEVFQVIWRFLLSGN